MKRIFTILLAGALATQLQALETKDLIAAAQKFNAKSGDAQYKARVELNQLIDQATAPGKDDPAEVTKAIVAALKSTDAPLEAKKYMLRKLAQVGTADAVDAMGQLLNGGNDLLKEEARLVLESIPGPKSIAVLEAALRKAGDKRAKLSLVNSLAMQNATQSIPAILPLLVDADPELARAGVTALAKIGGKEAVSGLQRAAASSKVAPVVKTDIEKAVLVAGLNDPETAAQIFKSTSSETVRLAAFKALATGELTAAKTAAIETALKSDNEALRQAALLQGLQSNLPSLQKGLGQAMDQLPKGDRLVVLSAIHLVKPAATAEMIALSSVKATDADERIAALAALGQIATKPAFEAVLQAVGAREPEVNQAAGSTLAKMDYAGADTALIAMLKGNSSADKVLAVKAAAHRQLPGVNALLLDILKSEDKDAAREAMKTIYFVATLDDLRTMATAAKSATDDGKKRMLTSLCKKVADRINTDEARTLVEGLN